MTIIHPQLPGGYVIYCDDIREEIAGKSTLVGTYGGEMTVFASTPARIGKLCALVVIRLDPANLPPGIIVRIVRLEGGEQTELISEMTAAIPDAARQMELPPVAPNSTRFLEMRLAQQFEGLEFAGPCSISTRMYIGDDEYKLGSLEVKIAAREEAAALFGLPMPTPAPTPDQNSLPDKKKRRKRENS